MAYLVAFIVLVSIVAFAFSSRKAFFGFILFSSSIYLAGVLFGYVYPFFGFLLGGSKFAMLLGVMLAVVLFIVMSFLLIYYTLLFGKYINIFIAIVSWIAVYFSYIDIGIEFVLSFEHMDMDIKFIDIGFIENLIIYFTVSGIASLFVWDLSYESSFSE